MECREVRQLAEAFVSEQLLVETTQAVVAHLERCPVCRTEVEALRRLRTATRAAVERASDLAPRPEFAASLAARLRADAARRPAAQMPRRRWLAVAASGLLAMGAGLGWRARSQSLSALLQDAVGDHRFCALTFKLDEPPISLDEAARRYGGSYARLNTVAPSTDALSGGSLQIVERHSCVFDGRRFAHLVLQYRGQAVSLLVTDDDRPGGSLWLGVAGGHDVEPALQQADGFHVASFADAGQLVFVVSSLPAGDVDDVAQAMSGPMSRVLTQG